MKKVLIFSIAFVTILLTMGTASAHWRTHFGFGLVLPPPVVWAPPVVYPSYPAYGNYGPGYYGHRVWVPGYWENRWTPYGWTRAWISGYWR